MARHHSPWQKKTTATAHLLEAGILSEEHRQHQLVDLQQGMVSRCFKITLWLPSGNQMWQWKMDHLYSFIGDFPIKTSIHMGFSFAMLDYPLVMGYTLHSYRWPFKQMIFPAANLCL